MALLHVGGIGVSGGTADQDEECAQAGIDAVKDAMKEGSVSGRRAKVPQCRPSRPTLDLVDSGEQHLAHPLLHLWTARGISRKQ